MRRLFFLVFSILAMLLFTPNSGISAVEYGGLGGLPANPDPDNPRTKSIFVHTLRPGETKRDAVNVINNGSETKNIEVYATDSEVASGGSFACTQKADDNNVVGSWIKLDKKELTLSPNNSEVIPFTISVPDNVSVGEHNGCIVIQEKTQDSQTPSNGVQLSFRSAIRVAITIPGDIKKDVEFSSINVKDGSKKYVITAQLKNNGNVSLDTDVQVYVKNWLNRTVYQNGGIYPLLAQKQPVELNYEFVRPFWGGFYRVLGTADYNGDPNTPLGSVDKNIRKSVPAQWVVIIPHPLAITLILLALLVMSILVSLIRHRRRRSEIKTRFWKYYKVQNGDTLSQLAKRCNANWKTIAKVNRLRPPYELQPGSTIKLPGKHIKR